LFGLLHNEELPYLNALLQSIYNIKELRNFYEKGHYRTIKIKAPMIKGGNKKFSAALE
jgi:ubiquitin C-terminal hydrolase